MNTYHSRGRKTIRTEEIQRRMKQSSIDKLKESCRKIVVDRMKKAKAYTTNQDRNLVMSFTHDQLNLLISRIRPESLVTAEFIRTVMDVERDEQKSSEEPSHEIDADMTDVDDEDHEDDEKKVQQGPAAPRTENPRPTLSMQLLLICSMRNFQFIMCYRNLNVAGDEESLTGNKCTIEEVTRVVTETVMEKLGIDLKQRKQDMIMCMLYNGTPLDADHLVEINSIFAEFEKIMGDKYKAHHEAIMGTVDHKPAGWSVLTKMMPTFHDAYDRSRLMKVSKEMEKGQRDRAAPLYEATLMTMALGMTNSCAHSTIDKHGMLPEGKYAYL